METNFNHIEDLLQKGNIEACLNEIKNHCINLKLSLLKNEALSEISRLNALNKEHHSGRLNHTDYETSLAKIRMRVLEIIDNVKLATVNQSSISEKDKIEANIDIDEKSMLEGVWRCDYSSNTADKITYYSSLLPDDVCIINEHNKETGEIVTQIFTWKYLEDEKVIVQVYPGGEMRSLVEWISPLKIRIRVLAGEQQVMTYVKVI